MTPRTRRLSRNPVVFWAFALLVGLSGTAARADALYTVTNLGSSGVTLTTAGGGTIAVSPTGTPVADLATSQLASVSNGQVSYSFATTPDTMLVQGRGAQSGLPAGFLNPDPAVYGQTELTGLSNTNGYAAIVAGSPLVTDPSTVESTAYGVLLPLNLSGALASGTPAAIFSPPLGQSPFRPEAVTITGINTANQALLGSGYTGFATLVYNFATQSLTNLQELPPFSTGAYFNPVPLAIDNAGQLLVEADADTPKGFVTDTLLLTPSDGPVTAPEPGTWMSWALIVGASWFAAKRGRTKP
jgi:hypothetical protein